MPTVSTIPSAPSTIGQDGKEGDFSTQAALSSVSARQTNNIVGAQSYYDVVFTTTTTGTIKFIDITFPAGTVIGAAPNLVEREGIGAGTAAKTSATVIRYTVTSAVSVPANTEIRLEFFNIVNPTAPSTGYKVTVTTRNAGGTVIDGPTTSNGFSMKQIGTGQIADGAATTPKIADNAITSTKPAESFMKRVTVKDDAAGHAVGWDPNGVTTIFTIFEPAITGTDTAFVIIEVISSSVTNCDVTGQSDTPTEFAIRCSAGPPNGAALHYVVGNLPSHVVS